MSTWTPAPTMSAGIPALTKTLRDFDVTAGTIRPLREYVQIARYLEAAGYGKIPVPEGYVVLNNKGVEFGQIMDQETAEKVRTAYQRMIDTETLRVAAVVPVTP